MALPGECLVGGGDGLMGYHLSGTVTLGTEGSRLPRTTEHNTVNFKLAFGNG